MKKYAVEGLDGYPNELAHKLDDALELNAEMLAELKKIEWKYMGTLEDDIDWIICPDCENERAEGHKPSCGLEQVVAKAEAE